jgi:3-methyladenine DNA glycosylase AlkD
MQSSDIRKCLQTLANPEKAEFLKRFFKTAPGQYGHGDIFLGITVPEQRKVAKEFIKLPLAEVIHLLDSKIHEERLTALIILTCQYSKAKDLEKEKIVKAYLKNLKFVNNWDLVDSSAHQILGEWLLDKDRSVLYKLAKSKNMWERRVSILSTFAFICHGEHKDTFAIAEILLKDQEDLMHKAIGWMLREVGKRVSMDKLRSFLKQHATVLPRTALRYSIEHLDPEERKKWMGKRK